jgi:hypothetical protein
MNADSILRELAQMARPVSASAAMRPPGPGCLTAAQMRQLAGGGPTPEATLLCLTEHVPRCDRCWSLVCVVLGEDTAPDPEADGAIDRALRRQVARLPEAPAQAMERSLLTLVLQWLPGPDAAQPLMAGAFADEDETPPMRLLVEERDLPLRLRLTSPEGTPRFAELILSAEDGSGSLRLQADSAGIATFRGPAGAYLCRVEGYGGPLLRREEG